MNSKSKDQSASFKNKQAKMYKDLLSPLYRNDDVDIDVSKKSKWSFEDIDNRSKALAKYILENVISK